LTVFRLFLYLISQQSGGYLEPISTATILTQVPIISPYPKQSMINLSLHLPSVLQLLWGIGTIHCILASFQIVLVQVEVLTPLIQSYLKII
jgi:hypothetical protein